MKTILIALSLLSSAPVWAEWTISGSSNSGMHYTDLATIRKDGVFRKVWTLTNSSNPDKDGVISKRARFEFDCKNETFRLLSLSHHSGNMATGAILFTSEYPNDEWTDIAPSTIAAIRLNIVCSK